MLNLAILTIRVIIAKISTHNSLLNSNVISVKKHCTLKEVYSELLE